jgi:putative DNA primase/helicase
MSASPSPAHWEDLITSALSGADIAALGVVSAVAPHAKRLTGYGVDGLLFPYSDPFGVPYLGHGGGPFYRIKPTDPGDGPKYLSPKGCGCRPYFPQNYDWPKLIKARSKTPIIFTEGEKTAAALCALGHPAIGLAGATASKDKSERQDDRSSMVAQCVEDEPIEAERLDESRVLPELVEAVELLGTDRQYIIMFDSDLVKNFMVQSAAKNLAIWLETLGARPMLCLLPTEVDGQKNGADDLIYRHGREAIDLLVKNAWPALIKKKDEFSINLPKELDLKQKALLAQAAFLRRWAYRAGYGWYKWDGKKWFLSDDGQGTFLDKDIYDLSDANGWKTQTNGVMNGLTRHLKAQLATPDERWNQTCFMPFQNGVLEILTGDFRPHSPTDWNTQVLTYEYDRTATAPTWLEFIGQALGDDPAAIALVQSFFRWALTPKGTGKLKVEVCWDLFGKPGTGKGTTLETLRNLVGRENAGTFKTSALTNPNYLAHLKDKPVSISSDDSGHLDDVGLFGELVSNEPVGVKLLYQNIKFTSLNTFFVRAYNDFVTTTGKNNSALDRRIVAMSFDYQPKIRDVELQEKLNSELAGIFNWAWSVGEAEMLARIKGAASIAAVAKASAERFEANNPVFTFLSEEYPKGGDHILPMDLYKHYKGWSIDCGRIPLNKREFNTKIECFGCYQTARVMGYRYWFIPNMENYSVVDNLGIAQLKEDPEPAKIIDLAVAQAPDKSQPRIEQVTRENSTPRFRIFTLPSLVDDWRDFLVKSGLNLLLIDSRDGLARIVVELNDLSTSILSRQNPAHPPAWAA